MHTDMGSQNETVPRSNESFPVSETGSCPTAPTSASFPKSGINCWMCWYTEGLLLEGLLLAACVCTSATLTSTLQGAVEKGKKTHNA